MQLPSILDPLLAMVGLRQVNYGAEETVTVSSVRLHKLGSPVDVKIPSLSFELSGNEADGLECSATDVSWPKPGFNWCGNSKYSFALLSDTSISNDDHKFNLMIYHDVGDRKADLRGGTGLDFDCRSQGDGPADEICKQDAPVTFKIDGPVANYTPPGALGFVTERFGERLCIAIYIACCVALQLLFWLVLQFVVSAVAISLLGFFIDPLYATITVTAELLSKNLHGSAIGFSLALGGAGDTVFPLFIGAIAESAGVWVLQPIILCLFLIQAINWLLFPRIQPED
ncbi:unnamed protein product [Clonostachys byssicola]|uniref:AA1-like domain-containing protein n=1 Tax=Clonostachys byssicola TaxID=160290 RepID=A0A9N9UDK3_9HYPO|nr:unnamed protein product [Clonostachys byssicola]